MAEEEAGPGAPDWIVTFSDMVCLLVTFFILLLTFSSLEDNDVFQIPSHIPGSPGAIENINGPTAADPPENDLITEMMALRGAEIPHSRPTEELAEELAELATKEREDDTPVDLADIRDGLVIHYDRRANFAPGSIELTPYLRKSLGELGRTLSHYPHTVVVEGHTDSAFQPTPRYATAEALSIARAREASRALVDGTGLSPKMVQIAGLGASRPLNAGETAVERSACRRVEVRILSLSQARADQVRRERDRKANTQPGPMEGDGR